MNKQTHLITLPPSLKLGAGGGLVGATVACETYGEPRDDNAVVLLHGLSRSHRAVDGEGDFSPHGWAKKLVGPGRPMDTGLFFVIAPNLLGSPFGSSSPLTWDGAGAPWGARFPELSVADHARALDAVLEAFGVRRARAVVGFSLGGMVALGHAALFPERVGAVATLLGPAALSESARQRLALAPQLLAADPEFVPGAPTAQGTVSALRRMRLRALRDLYPRDYLHSRHESLFAAERFLEAEADAFARAFDADCYVSLQRTLATCDLREALPAVTARVLLVSCVTDELALSSRVLDTYHALTAGGARTRYVELQSDSGHRALYLDQDVIAPPLKDLLR
jgi:homoserine O-acetyltransferase